MSSGIGREDERAQTLCDNGKVSIDNIGGSSVGEPASEGHRLVERVDFEVADRSRQICLSCRLSPDLGEDWVGGVQFVAALSRSLDQRPESRIQVLAVDD